jgi:hypothetical protein
MDPTIGVASGHANLKLAALMVSGFIDSLKLAVTRVLKATPVALFAGTTVLTVGGMVSGAAAVVKDQT